MKSTSVGSLSALLPRFSRLFCIAMTLRPAAVVKKIMWCAPASALMSGPEGTSSGMADEQFGLVAVELQWDARARLDPVVCLHGCADTLVRLVAGDLPGVASEHRI